MCLEQPRIRGLKVNLEEQVKTLSKMKHQVMSEQRGTHGVEKMTAVLRVALSGYYCRIECGQSARAVGEKELVERIQGIQGEVSHLYGSPRLREELLRHGGHVGKKRVARIIRANALGARQPPVSG
jgi:hypothetical protein